MSARPPAPFPSPEEQAVIDRFGIFDDIPVITGSGGAGDRKPTAGAGAQKATEAQLSKIVLILSDHGIETDDGQRQALADRIGRPLASRKDLTRAEASQVLDDLEKLPQPPAGGGDQ